MTPMHRRRTSNSAEAMVAAYVHEIAGRHAEDPAPARTAPLTPSGPSGGRRAEGAG